MHSDTHSVIVVMSRPTNPARDAEVRSWEADHAKILLADGIPGLLDVQRYEIRPIEAAKPPEGVKWDFERSHAGRYLTLYISSLDDPRELEKRTLDQHGAYAPGAELIHKGLYRLTVALHSDDYDAKKRYVTNGVTLAMTHPVDEARYEAWYVPVHLEDERAHGVNHSVTRFINVDEGSRPKSFVPLESDWEDIREVRKHINTHFLPKFTWPEGNVGEVIEIFAAADYQRIF